MATAALIFDLDDTLIEDDRTAEASYRAVLGALPVADSSAGRDPEEPWEVLRDAVHAVWRAGPHYELGVALGLVSWEGLWSDFEGNHPVLDGVRAWIPQFREEAWTAALAAVGVTDADFVPVADGTFRKAQVAGHPLIAGAAETVRALDDRFRFGLLTNGPSDIQRLKLAGTGLTPLFEDLVISGEIGVGKPEPAAFSRVLDGLDAGPGQAVMVGDSWERDIEGAVASGIPAVWIAAGRPVPRQLEGVTVVQEIGELVALLS